MPTDRDATTRNVVRIEAPRRAVYRAFVEPALLIRWLPPDGMEGHVHSFEAHEGGRFRISLRYLQAGDALPGKTSEDTDTYQGHFVELVPDEKVVEVVTFESQDPSMAGEMTITVHLLDRDGATELTVLCEDIPPGIRPEDNEMGWSMSLGKLAALVE